MIIEESGPISIHRPKLKVNANDAMVNTSTLPCGKNGAFMQEAILERNFFGVLFTVTAIVARV